MPGSLCLFLPNPDLSRRLLVGEDLAKVTSEMFARQFSLFYELTLPIGDPPAILATLDARFVGICTSIADLLRMSTLTHFSTSAPKAG
jgi:hypothetical protein